MLEFLLPHMQEAQSISSDVLILLANRYRTHLLTTGSFNLSNLEAHLYRTLDTEKRYEYATAVTVKYGGTSGAIELLTFLCCNGDIEDVTIPAAVELIMEHLERLPWPLREHRCLAYLFGTSKLWDATWKDKNWSYASLYYLSGKLLICSRHPFEPTSVRTLSDDRQFDLALARTMVMLLSPHKNTSEWSSSPWIKFLFGHLCQSPLPSLPDNDEQSDIIRLILENAALLRIIGPPEWSSFHPAIYIWSTAILAAIIRDLGRRLRDPEVIRDGEHLLAALTRTEVKGPDGKTHIWDLGKWLRTDAQGIMKNLPSSINAMRDVHDALGTIYLLCEHNPKLRAIWDRIGYSGPREDLVYSLDPYLDLGDFFARVEDPHSQSGA